MFAGLILLFVGKTNTLKKLGIILLGFGLMFYGLEAESHEAVQNLPALHRLDANLGQQSSSGSSWSNFTLIIQSSSATVAIVVTLASSGLISLPAGVAIMLGAESAPAQILWWLRLGGRPFADGCVSSSVQSD